MGFPFLVAAFALFLAACASTRLEEGFYEASRPKYAIEVDKEGRKQGKETWWHPNGRIKYEALNRNGIRHGRFTAWDSAGVKWYEGYEYHGKPESTLTYWHPNGRMKSQALYRDGIQLERKDWDESGRFVAPRSLWTGFPKDGGEAEAGKEEADRQRQAAARQAALQLWAMRVRQAVEGYWRLPNELAGKPLKAVSRIRVSREGRILEVTWLSKSPSAAFNSMAQGTFRKIKRLPPFPPQIQEENLDIQYEFVSQGKAAPRRKLEARGDDPGAGSPGGEGAP